MLFEHIIGLIGLWFLIGFSYADLKHSQIENKPILMFFLIGLVLSLVQKELWLTMAVMAFMLIFGIVLWKRGVFGGADAKILPCIVPFMCIGANLTYVLVGTWIFLIFFVLFGTIYGFMAKFMLKKKEVPFLPIIALSYLAFWIFRLFWLI